ncbi:MAG TPA: hypothetical protein DCX21_04605 [Eubacterium sp.]|nr:hypothetical protein [Eubacterium sp.]
MNNYARRSYKTAKRNIDRANLGILIGMIIVCALACLHIGRPIAYTPVIFLLGTVVQVLCAVRAMFDRNKLKLGIYAAVSVLILIFSLISMKVYWF